MKKCQDCNKEKEYSEFTIKKNPRGTGTTYYHSYCKACMVIRATKYRVENRESFNKYQSEYRKKHYDKESKHVRWKNRYYKDLEASRAKQRAYRKMQRERLA